MLNKINITLKSAKRGGIGAGVSPAGTTGVNGIVIRFQIKLNMKITTIKAKDFPATSKPFLIASNTFITSSLPALRDGNRRFNKYYIKNYPKSSQMMLKG